jgi:uncharacterized protein YlxW (UPF0749 family)
MFGRNDIRDSQDAQVKLEKKIKDYQDDLNSNKKDQQQQTDEIVKQKAALDQLKSKEVNQ